MLYTYRTLFVEGKTRHFITSQGLVDNTGFSICEDKAGNIWFGTGGGLSRYDGRSFQNFITKEGLSNHVFTIVMEDKTGKMWFSSRDGPWFYDG